MLLHTQEPVMFLSGYLIEDELGPRECLSDERLLPNVGRSQSLPSLVSDNQCHRNHGGDWDGELVLPGDAALRYRLLRFHWSEFYHSNGSSPFSGDLHQTLSQYLEIEAQLWDRLEEQQRDLHNDVADLRESLGYLGLRTSRVSNSSGSSLSGSDNSGGGSGS